MEINRYINGMVRKKYLFAYLDDIHTRGTDLKLPLECHGLLTVGINMEKDKLTHLNLFFLGIDKNFLETQNY